MAGLPFIKMHGCGNDYVFVDGFEAPEVPEPALLAKQVSDRRTGIGADGLIVMGPVPNGDADVEMRVWNADGSAGEMCGNGARCVALWMYTQGRVQNTCRIRTATRDAFATIDCVADHGRSGAVSVEMGPPSMCSTGLFATLNVSLPGAEETVTIDYTFVSMGNPHAVVFGQALTDRNVRQLGPLIQQSEQFPAGVNVEWVQVNSTTQLSIRVLERGSGETLACGSGACAAVVAAIGRGHCDRGSDIAVKLPGGLLTVRWDTSGGVVLSGPAEISFQGEWWAT